jgi:hypothetical protein
MGSRLPPPKRRTQVDEGLEGAQQNPIGVEEEKGQNTNGAAAGCDFPKHVKAG